MLELSLVRAQPEKVRHALENRGLSSGLLEDFLRRDEERRRAITEVESLKAENIVAQKLPPMTENELGGLIIQQANMSATVKFMEAMRWINRIESGRPLIHVNSVSISKRQGAAIGTTDVNCEIMTIIPKKRLDQ